MSDELGSFTNLRLVAGCRWGSSWAGSAKVPSVLCFVCDLGSWQASRRQRCCTDPAALRRSIWVLCRCSGPTASSTTCAVKTVPQELLLLLGHQVEAIGATAFAEEAHRKAQRAANRVHFLDPSAGPQRWAAGGGGCPRGHTMRGAAPCQMLRVASHRGYCVKLSRISKKNVVLESTPKWAPPIPPICESYPLALPGGSEAWPHRLRPSPCRRPWPMAGTFEPRCHNKDP